MSIAPLLTLRIKFTSLSLTFIQVVCLFRLLVNTSHQKNIHKVYKFKFDLQP